MDFSRSTAVCYTGHRLIPERDRELLWTATLGHTQALYARGYRTFIAGGAVGFDMLAAQVVCELRLTCPDMKLVLALPFRGHDSKFSVGDKHQLAELIELADEVVTLREHYSAGVYAARNRWMVEHASVCVCYLANAGRSGTAMTVDMARGCGLQIVNVA